MKPSVSSHEILHPRNLPTVQYVTHVGKEKIRRLLTAEKMEQLLIVATTKGKTGSHCLLLNGTIINSSYHKGQTRVPLLFVTN